MLRIRLTRTGKKGQPSYRVVVADVRSKRDGRVVERIGHYSPLMDPIQFKIEEERALHWLSVGAKPSNAVERLLKKQGTFERLSRLKEGEKLEHLVSEFEGVSLEGEAEAKAPAKKTEEAPTAELDEVDAAVVDAVETIIAIDEEE